MSSQASCQIQMPSLKLSQTPRSFPKSGFQNFLPFQRPSSVLNEPILSLNFLMNLRSEFGVRWGDGILVSSARIYQLNCWLLKEVVLRDHESVVGRVRPWECPSGPWVMTTSSAMALGMLFCIHLVPQEATLNQSIRISRMLGPLSPSVGEHASSRMRFQLELLLTTWPHNLFQCRPEHFPQLISLASQCPNVPSTSRTASLLLDLTDGL